MSEYQLPFHIQEEIMKRLPVKSLIQFRSVSKEWKSLIDSSEFIAAHSLHRHTQQQHLFVSYEDPTDEYNYVFYMDDGTFPLQRSVPTIPPSVKQLMSPRLVGSSHGLLCLYGSDPNYTTELFVLWNPSIRKSIVVAGLNLPFVGFGVCSVTNDPKIVSLRQSSWDVPETNYQCEVMLYTLSSGKWRSLSTNLPTKPLHDWVIVLVTDRFIYWHVKSPNRNMIMSFDVTNESFEVIDLPDSLANRDLGDFIITKVRESLGILQYSANKCDVWMMEHGSQRLFTKLFTIKTPYEIRGFRKSGVPIIQLTEHPNDYDHELVVYEPNSEHNNILEMSESPYLFYVNGYMETLLLLGRSDCISY